MLPDPSYTHYGIIINNTPTASNYIWSLPPALHVYLDCELDKGDNVERDLRETLCQQIILVWSEWGTYKKYNTCLKILNISDLEICAILIMSENIIDIFKTI